MRCKRISLLTGSLPCMLPTYFISGLPATCRSGVDDTANTHNSLSACKQDIITFMYIRTDDDGGSIGTNSSFFFFKIRYNLIKLLDLLRTDWPIE